MKSKLFLLLFFQLAAFGQTANFNSLTKEGRFSSYITENNLTFEVGQTIKIGLPSSGNQFTFITQSTIPAGPVIANQKVTISKIKVLGNKKKGFKAYLLFSGYGINCYIDIESALMVGEVVVNTQ